MEDELTMIQPEREVEKFLRENTDYIVENVSPGSKPQERINDGSCRHSGIADIILKHIETRDINRPQDVIRPGLPDIVCYKVKDSIEVELDKSKMKSQNSKYGYIDIHVSNYKELSFVKELKFVEVKKTSDSLNSNQEKWVDRFSDVFETEIAEVSKNAVFFYDASSYISNEASCLMKGEIQ